MELKGTNEHVIVGIVRRFNRTFMELKEEAKDAHTVAGHRFNRTFMELKATSHQAGHQAAPFQSHLYGIERFSLTGCASRILSFNRTFMELKVKRGVVLHKREPRFNRTFMELKEAL